MKKYKRDIPPIVDYVDPRRVPYDIMEDVRYNRNHPSYDKANEPKWVKRLYGDDRRKPLQYRVRVFIQYRIWKRYKRWFNPRIYWLYFCGYYHRLGRGWSEWDLDQYAPHSIDYLIEALDWTATKSWTYPAEYVDDPAWPENRHPDKGREVEGYREDLMKIKSGMLHVRNSLIENTEKCTCCGDWCNGWTDPKMPGVKGCPIIDEAWALYTQLFFHLWD